MSGSLIKIDEVNITSDVASFDLGGANWDSSFDVYKIVLDGVESADTSANRYMYGRVLTSNTAQTDANYDQANKALWSAGGYQNNAVVNSTFWYISTSAMNGVEDEGKESLNSIIYLFNFNNASEYSFITEENSTLNGDGQLYGGQGGAVKTTAEANNGMQFLFSGGNIRTGNAKLYGIVK
tara:strand:+ start:1301 stop:1843 length:543 start_codon:yes stop_codon:yes gene_type:complete